jgi:ribonucleoside-triphosphate reductase (thioredoxin)
MEYPIEDYRLPTDYQNFIANSRYSRWIEEEGRREIWPEPVVRYVESVVRPHVGDDLALEIFRAIASCEVMPSMRALMTAGEALERDHMAGYNCSFIAVDHPRAFDEILYILTCGTGVGFSCEQKFINKLPEVAETFHETDTTIVVADSRIGWASSFRELLSLLWSGKVPRVDVSRVRGKGERLKTFGGRASGPEPLVELFDHCIRTFRSAAGRKLNSLEVHSIVCKIGEIVVVGGVRRSALISLSDLLDNRMRHAKSGQWWEKSPEFALANNSAVYEEKPDVSTFLEEWKALYDSKSGERGIYNRDGIRKKTKSIGKRNPDLIVGTNPLNLAA